MWSIRRFSSQRNPHHHDGVAGDSSQFAQSTFGGVRDAKVRYEDIGEDGWAKIAKKRELGEKLKNKQSRILVGAIAAGSTLFVVLLTAHEKAFGVSPFLTLFIPGFLSLCRFFIL